MYLRVLSNIFCVMILPIFLGCAGVDRCPEIEENTDQTGSDTSPGDTNTDPDADPDTDPDADPDADPGTDPGTDPDTDPGTDPGTDPEPETNFGITSIYAVANVSVINEIEIGPPAEYISGSLKSNFQIILARDDWGGVSDYENACWVIFEFDEESATLDPSFVGDGKWAGWTVSGSESFKEQTPSCDNIYGEELTLLEHLRSSPFGVGAGQITTAMANITEEQYDEAGLDWVNEGAPYHFTQYLMLDLGESGGNTGWTPQNLGSIYEMDADNVLVTDEEDYLVSVNIEDAEWIPDGFMQGTIFFGWAIQ